MSITSVADALRWLGPIEGGSSSRTDDRAVADLWPGETIHTNHGVRQSVFDAWRDACKRPRAPVRTLDATEAAEIYIVNYWQAAGCAQLLPLSGTLALQQFDTAVNHGVGFATRLLQRELGVTADGAFGPKTRAAVTAVTAGGPAAVNALLTRLLDRRLQLYRRLDAETPVAEGGWYARLQAHARLAGLPPERYAR
jgi:lysozyme family protein